ncbi:NAD(P)H-binding protein [Prauserella oleivorans]
MKITVFGATGGTGTHVVGQALAAGHDVTAVVRGATRPEVPADSRLYVAEAPLGDPDALVPLVTGRDAVISALGAAAAGPLRCARTARDRSPPPCGPPAVAGWSS